MDIKISVIVALLATIVAAGDAAGTDTSFTYQGELKQNGVLAEGSFNLGFALWTAASAGSQIGSTVNLNGVEVAEGRFAVALDFGADAFGSGLRWLNCCSETMTAM